MNLAIATSPLPGNYVNPNYLDDLNRRVSVARADGTTYAFDDRCTHEAWGRIGERWLSLTVWLLRGGLDVILERGRYLGAAETIGPRPGRSGGSSHRVRTAFTLYPDGWPAGCGG